MHRALVTVVALVLTLTACATKSSAPPSGTGTASPEAASPTSAASPISTGSSTITPGDPDLPVPTKGPRAGGSSSGQATTPVTLTGIPRQGVESNCWLLDGYLLIGVPSDLLGSDQMIMVTGHTQDDLITTCQQAIPLIVDTAVPADFSTSNFPP